MSQYRWLIVGAALVALVSASTDSPPKATPTWRSGFENGFPSEFYQHYGKSFSKNDVLSPGQVSAWSIVGRSQFPHILSGNYVYKGWIAGQSVDSHRPYPVLHLDIATPAVNSFWVWLDVDYEKLQPTEWIHFATWGRNLGKFWDVHTLSVRDRRIEMAHLEWRYVGPEPQPEFPLKRWVRLAAYIHYAPHGDGLVCVWQDGELMLTGNWSKGAGAKLTRAHWGLYAPGSIDRATQYNDEIHIWTLSRPLSNCSVAEPQSPYGNTAPTPMPR